MMQHRRILKYLTRLCFALCAAVLSGCMTVESSHMAVNSGYTTVESVDQSTERRVITGTQVTYSLSSALLAGTGIEVVNIPVDGRKFESLKDYIQRRMDALTPVFASAEAVVSMTNVLPSDPLFRFAREANIRLVNIDAAQPWSFDSSGVSIIQAPNSDVYWASTSESATASDSPYFWLSPSNAVRMADIIGSDLARVFPVEQAQIIANRDALKQSLLELSREYQNKFLSAEEITLFALANEFVYLTNDLGLYVDGYFLKQDIDWTVDDLNHLTEYLESRDINVVVHKWEPKADIVEAIQNAGAKLVVLDTANPGMSEDRRLVVDGYQQILRENLASLFAAVAD